MSTSTNRNGPGCEDPRSSLDRPAPGPSRAAASAGLVAAALAACAPASGGDPEFWVTAPGHGGHDSSSAASGGGGASPGSSTGTGAGPTTAPPAAVPRLGITFTTASFDGKYAPKNVGAVWIANADDAFVKTIETWGKKRIKYVTKWKNASASNTVDAVTSATRSAHGTHELEWDMTDVAGQVVPDGLYRVYLELTEENGAGPWTSIEIEKSTTPLQVTPPDTANYTGQHLTFDPGAP